MTTDAEETKALRLARYLREFSGLRSTMVRHVDQYEAVLWFDVMPKEPDCRSPAWNDDFEPGDPWLEVHKQQFPKPPNPPEIIVAWLDNYALKQAGAEMPSLRPSILEPDLQAPIGDGEEPPLVERHLADRPEIIRAYDLYRPSWLAWSAEYIRRGRVQSVYAELFRFHTQLKKQGEIVELVIGLGLLDWPKSPSIRRHVVTARVDVIFDPATGVIQVKGAADGAQLAIEDDMLEAELRPQLDQHASFAEQLKAIDEDIWDQPRMFEALRSWAESLHADTAWSPDLRRTVGADDRPAMAFAPALILRRRTHPGMVRTYDAIVAQLKMDLADAPLGWQGLVEDLDDREGDDSPSPPGHPPRPPSPGSQDIYFPLPANREQRRIVEALDRRRGVLVQGPPGTGKSHTIANLMCHLLATGKRVLITAETGRALQVLKEKLPPEIQPLCVSLLGQNGDAFAELNSAVQGITTRHAAWRPGVYDDQISEVDREIVSKRKSTAEIDGELRSLRQAETHSHQLANGAYSGTASAIAERCANERARFDWLRLPRETTDDPPVTQEDAVDWLRICRHHSAEAIARAALRIADSSALPPPTIFAEAVAAEREAAQSLRQFAEFQSHPAYQSIAGLNGEERVEIERKLKELTEERRKLDRTNYAWAPEVLAAALEDRLARWQALFVESGQLIRRIERLVEITASSSVTFPSDKQLGRIRADASAAFDYLLAGGKWTQFGVLTASAAKPWAYLRGQVKVDDQPADTPDRLSLLCNHIDLSLAFASLDQAWADSGGLPQGSQARIRLEALREQVAALGRALDYARTCLTLEQALNGLAAAALAPDWLIENAKKWREMFEARAREGRYQAAVGQVEACLRGLLKMRDLHDVHPVVAALIRAVEQRHVSEYGHAFDELRLVERTRSEQKVRHAIETRLRSVIPELVDAVARSVEDPAWNQRFADWERAWNWAIADNWLQKRSDPSYQQQLWQRARTIDAEIAASLVQSVELRAWTHFFNRLRPAEAAALRAWRETVKAMGKGTGRSSKLERLRREARQYMEQCRDAIPVWIMPRYLVAEMINPAPDRFDTIIVDEASQLGIDSLFLFYIGKKIVVVGDDQQISPYGVGIADEAVAALQNRYLDGMSYRSALSPQSSLYANAKIRFGQNVVLREHFRCMPEIIQFSNDLCYANNGTPLDPLRAYAADRLTPLVQRHVNGGFRSANSQNPINEPEAEAILAQIIACIGDPRYTGRTMGVISLQGDAQAKLIERRLLEALEPEIIEERRLICGDAYAFQGDERHIIFLSMVAAPNERIGALSNESARQRFNVAASRAQDQLWLFHSVTPDVLSPACMRRALLDYMLHPGRASLDKTRQIFDSQFERDVFGLIGDKGFYVRTQVCVGDPTNHRYRIDLVVEGMRGRLAVECDGDQWHGADRYEQDMARQRDLERAGWRFVRIRGGDFYRDRVKAMEPLWAELDRLGIAPGGIDEAAGEPPPPSTNRKSERREVEEHIPVLISPANVTGDAGDADRNPPTAGPAPAQTARAPDAPAGGFDPPSVPASSSFLDPYIVFDGEAGPDPRNVNGPKVADGLCRIIEVEGPMLAKRAYDLYLRGCGIRRLGGDLRNTMDKALASAIRDGRVVSMSEGNEKELISSTVRIAGSPGVKARRRGPRTFEEIPPGELRNVARTLLERNDVKPGADEHLRAILEVFDLKRLTTQVGTTLLDILDRQDLREGTPRRG